MSYSWLQAGDQGVGDDEEAAEIHAFDGLTPLQRRKAHIVAEFMGLGHESEGGPGNRVVLITRKEDGSLVGGTDNPMREKDHMGSVSPRFHQDPPILDESTDISNTLAVVTTLVALSLFCHCSATLLEAMYLCCCLLVLPVCLLACDVSEQKDSQSGDGTPKSSIRKSSVENVEERALYEENFKRVAEFGVAGLVLALASRDSTDDQVCCLPCPHCCTSRCV